MPASLPKSAPQTFILDQTKVAAIEKQLYQSVPHLQVQLQNIINQRFASELSKTPDQTMYKPNSTLTEEEVLSILKKIHELSQLPGLTLDNETELYLEQQLADMLGFEVGITSDKVTLPFMKGTIDSLTHLYRSPTQSLQDIQSVREASIAKHRSSFGWHLNNSGDTTTDKSPSDFWIALPLRAMATPERSYADIKRWAFKKKMMVINPSEAIYCVAEIQDEYFDATNRYQFGGSPELIRRGLFWSPGNVGKALLFFVTDHSDSIKTGRYQVLS